MPVRSRRRAVLWVLATLAWLSAVDLQGQVIPNQAVQTPPISLGSSGGAANDISSMFCCSGTLGALVTKNDADYILSADHVLAGNDRQAIVGENIIQPGLIDNNCSLVGVNYVATFAEGTSATSNVDAALATVVPGAVDPDGTILGIGIPAATPAAPVVHETVAKSGRATGLTCDAITSVSTDVSVQYQTQCGMGDTYVIAYTNQILINSPKFSGGGDSGALLVDANTSQPVGLLFAGSNTTTVAHPIQDVMAQLQFQFVGGSTHSVSCPPNGNGKKSRISPAAFARARAVKDRDANKLMLDPAVMAVGVGAGDESPGQAVLVVYVEQGRSHALIPSEIDGVRTRIVQTDRIRAQGWNEPQGGACRAAKQ